MGSASVTQSTATNSVIAAVKMISLGLSMAHNPKPHSTEAIKANRIILFLRVGFRCRVSEEGSEFVCIALPVTNSFIISASYCSYIFYQ